MCKKVNPETMLRIGYSHTICWKRTSGRHWVEYIKIDEVGARCLFCGMFIPREEIERAEREK